MTTAITYDAEATRSEGRIPPLLKEWIETYGLETEFAPNLYTVTTWTKHCSPANASEESRAIACMDILLWLFYLDDYNKNDYESFFDRCLTILNGIPPSTEMPPLFHAFHNVVRRVADKGKSMEYFLEGRRLDVECYRWRNNLRQSKNPVTFDEYLSRRRTTIYITQWMELWEILEDFILLPEERSGDLISATVEAVIGWHIFQNELVSVERDKISGDPNLILLFRDENNCSLRAAIEHIEHLRDGALKDFTSRYNSSLTTPAAISQHCRRYLDLLNICLIGGVNNYQDNLRRYNTEILDTMLADEQM